MKQESENQSKNVVELSGFRKKKETAEEFARGRNPLYVSHNTGKISGSKSAKTEEDNFGDRYQRIKASLEKINRLMAELKKISSTSSTEPVESKATSKQR
jgi:predicted transcriptional regulator